MSQPAQAFAQTRLASRAALLGLAILLVSASFIGMAVWREAELRGIELRSAETEATNLSRSIIRHIDDTVEIANTVLQGIGRRLELEGTAPEAIADLQGFIDLRKQSNDRLRGIFVYDAKGAWLATSEQVDIRRFNNSDREYFQHHQRNASPSVYIGLPIRSRSGGQWIIPISRRFNKPDGSFGGVVLATVDVGYFEEFFGSFSIGPRGAIALVGENRIMMARVPRDERALGREIAASGEIGAGARQPSLVFTARSPIDGVERITAVHRSARQPVYIVVAMATADVLGSWRHEAIIRLALTGLLVVSTAALALYSVRRAVERQHMTAALKATEAEFRLLAEGSSDMVSRVRFDGTIDYVSPSSVEVVGWRPAELVGTNALSGIDPEDLPAVEGVVADLRSGVLETAKISYRNMWKGRASVWVESSIRVTRNVETGAVDGLVVVTRDITPHKTRERELADLAGRDSLTSIANRRVFDGRLETEWLRSQREGTTLGLILVDVDYFKRFNDTYGHQQGDVCLRQVAIALLRACQRPADLVARYGGEEFVVILPGTDLVGACEVGERIVSEVRALAIPHSASEADDIVTVSLGVAVATPTPQGLWTKDQLVAAADRALYAAKAGGRNRVTAGTALANARSAAA